ncbi:MAG TPA: YdeI/OmpD-associated family protein [Gemmatimonadaceae bacterium]|nr:YdeI/OmpD-associated family protein [Gemmatimonadaceae bacterium]
MPRRHSFTAPIESADGGGAFVSVPFDVEAAFGSKRPRIAATIDGEPYRGLLTRMGGECHLLIVRKEIRERIGKGPGDQVTVTVERDEAPREVAVPDDLAAALSGAALRDRFDALAYTHRKEWVAWVTGAKKTETRTSRVARTVEALRAGQKAPR